MSEPLIRPLPLPELTPRETEAPDAAPATVPENVVDTVREGHRIARAIIARATSQAREIQAAAEEAGAERGARLAFEREGKALRDAATALLEAAARFDLAQQDLRERLESTLPELAVAIAERILRRELNARPDLLVHVIRDAIATILPAERVEVRLHPDDLATFERHREALADVTAGVELRFEPTPEVGRGGSEIETEALVLAAGIPQQVERALALLKEEDA